MSSTPSPTPLLILVHSPLVGPSTWRPVAEALAAGGFEARTPSLLGLAAGPGPYAERFAAAVAVKADAALTALTAFDARDALDGGAGTTAGTGGIAGAGPGHELGPGLEPRPEPRPGPRPGPGVGHEIRNRLGSELGYSAEGEPPSGPDIVLVAHSGAGAYLPVIAEALAGRVIGAVFVDAQLPRPGRSDFDTSPAEFAASVTAMARDGVVPPWNEWFPPETLASLIPDPAQRESFLAELHPIALDYFREPMPPAPSWAGVPCAYLQLSEGYREQADRAAVLGWPTQRIPGHHLAVLTDPGPVAVFLSEFVQSLAIG